MKIENKGLIF